MCEVELLSWHEALQAPSQSACCGLQEAFPEGLQVQTGNMEGSSAPFQGPQARALLADRSH